jgi:hypothetical protein
MALYVQQDLNCLVAREVSYLTPPGFFFDVFALCIRLLVLCDFTVFFKVVSENVVCSTNVTGRAGDAHASNPHLSHSTSTAEQQGQPSAVQNAPSTFSARQLLRNAHCRSHQVTWLA